MTTYAEILNAALRLPPRERSELAETLRHSVPLAEAGNNPPLSEAWEQEIASRGREIDAGTATYVTYEQTRTRARRAAGHDG